MNTRQAATIVFHVSNDKSLRWDFGKYEVEPRLIYAAQKAAKDPETKIWEKNVFESSEVMLEALQAESKGFNTYGIVRIYFSEPVDPESFEEKARKQLDIATADINTFTRVDHTYNIQIFHFATVLPESFDEPIPYENRADNPDNAVEDDQ